MKSTESSHKFTHQEYRYAKIVHMVNKKQEVLFYHQGNLITKEEADLITKKYIEEKRLGKF